MKTIKKLFFCLLLTLVSLSPAVAADTLCARLYGAYPQSGVWSRDCGPEPGKDFADELKKDCAQTVRQIQARPGASWNSEFGWASESQCADLENNREG
jgi:hypothetical protein